MARKNKQQSKKVQARIERLFARWNADLSAYLSRRPHRSFKRTLRRDHMRPLDIPGYVALTRESFALIICNWRTLGLFFIVYSVASAVILGVVDQNNYSTIASLLRDNDSNIWSRTYAIFGTAITGGLNPTSSANGQVTGVLLVLLAWLTLIWLLRHMVNHKPVVLREGLYNAGAPIISTVLVVLVAIVQCLPLLVIVLTYNAASKTGLLAGGIESMLYYGAAALLALMSLYWLVSTFIALVIVTLPGMYPMAALRAAGDLAIGRRLRLILRFLWMSAIILLIWIIILVPVILLDNWLTITWLPLVPICVLALSGITLIVSSTYIYLLYRKLVEDDSKPA